MEGLRLRVKDIDFSRHEVLVREGKGNKACSEKGGSMSERRQISFIAVVLFSFTATTASAAFIDNGDGTISDDQTGLTWEKKDDAGGIHDKDSVYTWSTCNDYPTCSPDGTAFTVFLATLNTSPCFAGHCDWRLPTTAGNGGFPTGQAAEAESIVDPSAPGCGSGSPCAPAAFNANCTPTCTVIGCSCTVPNYYWTASSFSPSSFGAWFSRYDVGDVDHGLAKTNNFYVRAVRGSFMAVPALSEWGIIGFACLALAYVLWAGRRWQSA